MCGIIGLCPMLMKDDNTDIDCDDCPYRDLSDDEDDEGGDEDG